MEGDRVFIQGDETVGNKDGSHIVTKIYYVEIILPEVHYCEKVETLQG